MWQFNGGHAQSPTLCTSTFPHVENVHERIEAHSNFSSFGRADAAGEL